jgi:hypothetical protein
MCRINTSQIEHQSRNHDGGYNLAEAKLKRENPLSNLSEIGMLRHLAFKSFRSSVACYGANVHQVRRRL